MAVFLCVEIAMRKCCDLCVSSKRTAKNFYKFSAGGAGGDSFAGFSSLGGSGLGVILLKDEDVAGAFVAVEGFHRSFLTIPLLML